MSSASSARSRGRRRGGRAARVVTPRARYGTRFRVGVRGRLLGPLRPRERLTRPIQVHQPVRRRRVPASLVPHFLGSPDRSVGVWVGIRGCTPCAFYVSALSKALIGGGKRGAETNRMAQGVRLACVVIENVSFDDDAGAVIVSVRPTARARYRCGRCGRRSVRYDRGEGRRRWRALDMGTTRVFVEADAPRARCRDHGPTVTRVPWARHGAGHTRDFDDHVAWLAVQISKTAVVELLRVAWRTVGAILARVAADIDRRVDRLAGLRRIGIDEISYKRGHYYLTVVVDHDTGRLVWAAPGREDATIHLFFDALGRDRSSQLSHVSADMAPAIARVLSRHEHPRRSAAPTRSTSSPGAPKPLTWSVASLEHGDGSPTHQRHRPPQIGRRCCSGDQTIPLCVVEEPRGSDRPAAPTARLDHQDRPSVVAGLPAQLSGPRGRVKKRFLRRGRR